MTTHAKPAKARSPLAAAEKRLLKFALALPETFEDFPWNERVVKVRKKIFVILGFIDDLLRIGVKLGESHEPALSLPFAEPMGYGLGKSGWLVLRFAPADAAPPLDILEDFIGESYALVAPKKLAALVAAGIGRR